MSAASFATVSSLSRPTPRRVAVVGASLGGLAAAQALNQAGWTVHVFERASGSLHDKGGGLGFVHVPAWESLCQKPMMRRQRRASRAQGSFYYGDLWSFLYDGLPDKTVRFGKTITELHGNLQEQPVVDGVPYDLVILADGGFSSLRKYVLGNPEDTTIEGPQPDYAGYVVWRGGISVRDLPKDVLLELEEGVYKSGIYDTIMLKMAKDNGEDVWMLGTFIATPEDEISGYWNKAKDGAGRHHSESDKTICVNVHVPPDWFQNYFAQHFGHVPGLSRLLVHMLQSGEIQPHPQFEFGAPRVSRGHVVLLGDAAHMANPRTAVGAHTAILDALSLRESFQSISTSTTNDAIDHAIALYSQAGVERAQALHNRSRQLSQQFVPAAGLSKIVSPSVALSASSNQ
jgi:2-polyprenyl-6-methoxyphenol hydroxylase-like FAD-dependent oxidoreductase